MPIDTVQDLRDHLQLAIEVELSTIPPYLYAYYSIDDRASTSAKYIRSVATEEMLHAILMANIMLGVGGNPRFYDPEVIPRYPGPWPNKIPELILNLAPCTPEVVTETFLGIEAPGRPDAPDQPDHYESQGQFYHAVEQAIRALASQTDLFADPQLVRQLADRSGYVAVKYDVETSGGLVVVDGLEAALTATEVAIHQGEGVHEERYADPDHRELTHYSKFLSLVDGTVEIGEVRPMVTNPTLDPMPADVRSVAEFSNALYCYLFVVLDRLIATECEDRHHLVGMLYGMMIAMLAPVCRYLTTLPAGGGRVWGPPFEYHQFDDPAAAETELRRMGEALRSDHPALTPALRHLDRL
jgi:rubrerythrin